MNGRETKIPFWKDQSGATLVYVSIMMAALIGVIGMSIDYSRLFIADSEMQAAADAAAIAAASQLDGQADSITRADQAAAASAIVGNSQKFAGNSGGQTGQIISILPPAYLASLPASDDTALSDYTTDPLDAEFVEITTEVLTHNNLFLSAVGVAKTKTLQATAVAGQDAAICRITPLAICNPEEATISGANFNIEDWRGRQIRVRQQGPGSPWAPGNFGFLNVDIDGSSSNGAKALAETLAAVDGVNRCFSTLLDTQPGSINAVRNALNTRFDIYNNPFFGNANGAYPPAPNVTKGRIWTGNGGNVCNAVDVPGAPVTAGLPRDANIVSNPTNRIGNGIWDCLTYWNVNHPTDAVPAGCTSSSNANSGLSRYEVYRMEIDMSLIPKPETSWDCQTYWNTHHSTSGITKPAQCTVTTNTSSYSRYDLYEDEINNGLTPALVTDNSAEDGAPVCYGGSTPISVTPGLDRRIINFAVMNCLEHGVGGNSTDVPAEAFVRAFMTEPADDPSTPGASDFDVYLEIVDILVIGNNNGVLKETVEIFR